MEYKIRYDCRGESRRVKHTGKWLRFCICSVAGLGILGVIARCADVDFKVLFSAADNMADMLNRGIGVREAFSGFCLDLLRGTV